MNIDGSLMERKDKPAYVRFERRPIEDKAATMKEQRLVMKDIDYAIITAPYSKDEFIIKVDSWFAQMKIDVSNGKTPKEWEGMYREAYQHWQNGQEMPLNGTAIRGWGVISPAQQETLIRMNVRTVEDLASINDEGLRRVGMGAIDLKNKANAWLAQLQDKGPLTIKMSALQQELENMKVRQATLEEQNEKLKAMVPAQQTGVAFVEQKEEIQASDIIDDDEPKPKRGKR
jgi:hypothetical protein